MSSVILFSVRPCRLCSSANTLTKFTGPQGFADELGPEGWLAQAADCYIEYLSCLDCGVIDAYDISDVDVAGYLRFVRFCGLIGCATILDLDEWIAMKEKTQATITRAD